MYMFCTQCPRARSHQMYFIIVALPAKGTFYAGNLLAQKDHLWCQGMLLTKIHHGQCSHTVHAHQQQEFHDVLKRNSLCVSINL